MCRVLMFILCPVLVILVIGAFFGLDPFARVRHYHIVKQQQKQSVDYSCQPNDDHNGSLCLNGTAKQFLDSGAPPATTNNLSKSRRTFDPGGGGSDVGDGRAGTDETVEDVKEEAAKGKAEDQAEI